MAYYRQLHLRAPAFGRVRPTITPTLKFARRAYVNTSNRSCSSNGGLPPKPAAAVPNPPSPFQLTPEFLQQQRVSQDVWRVPPKRGHTTRSVLETFGRDTVSKLPDVDTMEWEELFRLNNQKLVKLGMGVQERKYLLWCLEKFRQGEDPKNFAKEEPKKKTVRGWGPPVRKKSRS